MSGDEVVAEPPVASEETQDVKADKKEEREPPAKVDKPNDNEFNEKLMKLNDEIKKQQAIVDEVRRVLDAKGLNKGAMNEEQLTVKNKLEELRAKSKGLIEERNAISARINEANEAMASQTKQSRELKSRLQNYSSVEAIDEAIKQLTFTLQTSSVTLKREKEIMAEIEKLRASKGLVKTYADQEAVIKGTKENTKGLHEQLKAKNAELSGVKEQERKQKEAWDKVKAANMEKRSDVPSLLKKKDEARGNIDKARTAIRALRDDFQKAQKEYQKYARYQQKLKQEERRKRQQEEWEARRAEREAYYQEVLDMPAWTKENAIIDNLKVYLEKFRPKSEEEKKAEAEAEAAKNKIPEGDGKGTFVQKNKESLDGMYAGFGAKKGKKGKSASSKPKEEDNNLRHSMDVLSSFEKLGLKAPLKKDDVEEALASLEKKREWYGENPDDDPTKKSIRAKMEKEKAEIEEREAQRAKEREAKRAEREAEREAQKKERDAAKENGNAENGHAAEAPAVEAQ